MGKLKAGDDAFIVLAEKDGDGNAVAVVVNRPLKECEEYLIGIFAFDNEADANIAKDKANIVINMRRYESNQEELRRRLDRRQYNG